MPVRPEDDLDEPSAGPDSPGRPGLPVDIGRLWLSLKRDWKIVPIAGVVWGLLGLGIAFGAIKHSYKSEGVLVWEPTGGGQPDQRVLATQAASIKMPITLNKVAERLKLNYPVRTLQTQVDVWFDRTTHLVTVETKGPSPEKARELARTVIDVFVSNQADIARARASDIAGALHKDLDAAKKELAVARKVYDAFRAEHGIGNIETETALAAQAAAQLRGEQQRAQTEALALGARAAELGSLVKAQGRTSVQSATSSNADAVRLNMLRTDLASAQARFAPDHPHLRALQAQISAFEARVATGKNVTENVVVGVNPEYQSLQTSLSSTRADQEAASKRTESLQQFSQGAEKRVAELSALEGKARELAANLEVVSDRIQALEVQHSIAQDAVRTPPTEFRLLTPATLAEWPERSRRRSVIIGMPLAGVLVALLVLLLRPLRDGRIYTAREAAFWANMPVVSSSSWPRDRDSFFSLIDELGDVGGGARGFTLVIGATGRERVLAEELAYWLGGSSIGNDGKVEVRSATDAEGAARTEAGTASEGGHAGPIPVPYAGSGAPGPSAAGHALALVQPGQGSGGSSALAPYQRSPGPITAVRNGTHVWVGDDGPVLRRAARAADRVLVVLTSGTELFASLGSLRTRLGRENGVAVLLLGVDVELLRLPDRVGDVERFWRQAAPRG